MEDLIKRLEDQVIEEINWKNILDEISWGVEYGILISVNDVVKLLNHIKKLEELILTK